MTQITPELLNAVMRMQGAPNTTDNLNRIAEFAAVHPEMLEQYIGKGTDQSAVGGSIDRSIATTDGGPKAPNSAVNTLQANPVASRGLADPNGYISTVDPNTGMSNIGPRLTKTPEPTGRGGARKPAGIPGDYNAPVGAPPFPKPTAAAPGDDGLGVPWWLLPFAARRNAKPPGPGPSELPPRFQPGEVVPRTGPEATYVGPMNRNTDPRLSALPGNTSTGALPPPPPQITGSNAPTYPSGAPEITPNDINAATRGEAQRQVDAENERLLREEMAKQNAKPRPVRPARPGIR